MLYSLPTGKVIELSVQQYLELTDEEFEYLISINYGEEIQNPFFGSILQKPNVTDIKIIEETIIIKEDIIEEIDDSIDYIPEED